MLIFGHMGIGYKITSPLKNINHIALFFLGTLAPDIFDKSLYLVMVWLTGRHGEDIGLISGTRTFAHTLYPLMLIFLLSKSKSVYKSHSLEIALGMTTHLLLDCISSLILYPDKFIDYWTVLFWPMLGFKFPSTHYNNLEGFANYVFNGYLILFECIGFAILSYYYLKHRQKKQSRNLSQ